MQIKIIEKLCCPFDHSNLNLIIFKQQEDEVIEGVLLCEKCHRYYPIITGIPIMSPDEYREQNLEIPFLKKWEEKLPKLLKERFETLLISEK